MSTQAQILANQLNSQKSCGPKTEIGKATTAANPVNHGLTGKFKVQSWEDQNGYDESLASLKQEFNPQTPTESELVRTMAEHLWLKNRALYLQERAFTSKRRSKRYAITVQPDILNVYMRYETTHQRAYYKALNTLLQLRELKRKEQIGFVSQKAKAATATIAQATETRRDEIHQLRKKHLTAGALLLEGRLARLADDRNGPNTAAQAA
jgi:hypothetical protein